MVLERPQPIGSIYMPYYLKLINIVLLSVVSSSSYAETLKAQYESFTSSVTSSKFEFNCGNATYKLEKTLFKSPKLYFNSGLDWHEVSDLELKPTGLKFDGTGVIGDIPLSLLSFEEDIPIYDYSDSKRTKYDFYKDITRNKFIPMKSEINFYKAQLLQRNSRTIVRTLSLDAEKYAEAHRLFERQQKFDPLPSEHYKTEIAKKKAQLNPEGNVFEAFTNEVLLKAEAESIAAEKRRNQVKRVINSSLKTVTATTDVGTYEVTNYCYGLE